MWEKAALYVIEWCQEKPRGDASGDRPCGSHEYPAPARQHDPRAPSELQGAVRDVRELRTGAASDFVPDLCPQLRLPVGRCRPK